MADATSKFIEHIRSSSRSVTISSLETIFESLDTESLSKLTSVIDDVIKRKKSDPDFNKRRSPLADNCPADDTSSSAKKLKSEKFVDPLEELLGQRLSQPLSPIRPANADATASEDVNQDDFDDFFDGSEEDKFVAGLTFTENGNGTFECHSRSSDEVEVTAVVEQLPVVLKPLEEIAKEILSQDPLTKSSGDSSNGNQLSGFKKASGTEIITKDLSKASALFKGIDEIIENMVVDV